MLTAVTLLSTKINTINTAKRYNIGESFSEIIDESE